jgi:hypothetical protein
MDAGNGCVTGAVSLMIQKVDDEKKAGGSERRFEVTK